MERHGPSFHVTQKRPAQVVEPPVTYHNLKSALGTGASDGWPNARYELTGEESQPHEPECGCES